MQTESLGKVLPQILFPFVRQWAERSGMTVVTRILADDQFLELVAKYADELIVPKPNFAAAAPANGNGGNGGNGGSGHTNGNGYANGYPPGAASDAAALANLHARVGAMETQLQAQQALFEMMRARIRPLALALGCCPDCIVGVDGCPRCWGQSKVAHFQPDYKLLRAQVLDPLAARGVPLTPSETPRSRPSRQSKNKSITKKRSKSWPKK